MKTEKLVKLLQKGYPHFKEGSGLSSWVVPEHVFNRLTDELGDESILELCQPLQLADSIEELVDRCPDPETISAQTWQAAVKLWLPHTQVKPMVDVCLNAAANILRLFRQGRLAADPMVVCRGMAVLGYAPFVPAGESLMKELMPIFDVDASEPAHLVKKYMERVSSGDAAFIKRVDECVGKDSYWMEWSRRFLQRMRDFPYTPKLVGITPPISGELIGVLAQMMKEEG